MSEYIELITAAEKYSENYNDDDRSCIKTDVVNAFYAGAKYSEALRANDREAQAAWNKLHDAVLDRNEELHKELAATQYVMEQMQWKLRAILATRPVCYIDKIVDLAGDLLALQVSTDALDEYRKNAERGELVLAILARAAVKHPELKILMDEILTAIDTTLASERKQG